MVCRYQEVNRIVFQNGSLLSSSNANACLMTSVWKTASEGFPSGLPSGKLTQRIRGGLMVSAISRNRQCPRSECLQTQGSKRYRIPSASSWDKQAQ